LSYWVDREEKRKYWNEYAEKILKDPNATSYQCKTALIGIGHSNPAMRNALEARKYKTLKL